MTHSQTALRLFATAAILAPVKALLLLALNWLFP